MIPSENRLMNDPVLTSKVWDNELASKTDFREGHGWSEIMDNIKEGDKVINGIGEVFICTYQTNNSLSGEGKDFNNGLNWSVDLHPTKKDGSLNKGMSFISYVNFGTGWSRV
jgi:hypothetical protein